MDREQSARFSVHEKEMENTQTALHHNFHLQNEYMKGEEGVDFVVDKPGAVDPDYNEKKLEREIKAELEVIAEGDREFAHEMEKKLFDKNSAIDVAFAEGNIPEDEI